MRGPENSYFFIFKFKWRLLCFKMFQLLNLFLNQTKEKILFLKFHSHRKFNYFYMWSSSFDLSGNVKICDWIFFIRMTKHWTFLLSDKIYFLKVFKSKKIYMIKTNLIMNETPMKNKDLRTFIAFREIVNFSNTIFF